MGNSKVPIQYKFHLKLISFIFEPIFSTHLW